MEAGKLDIPTACDNEVGCDAIRSWKSIYSKLSTKTFLFLIRFVQNLARIRHEDT